MKIELLKTKYPLGYQNEIITSKGYINVKKTCNRLSGPRPT
jgi:hypothetical protein